MVSSPQYIRGNAVALVGAALGGIQATTIEELGEHLESMGGWSMIDTSTSHQDIPCKVGAFPEGAAFVAVVGDENALAVHSTSLPLNDKSSYGIVRKAWVSMEDSSAEFIARNTIPLEEVKKQKLAEIERLQKQLAALENA